MEFERVNSTLVKNYYLYCEYENGVLKFNGSFGKTKSFLEYLLGVNRQQYTF